MNFNTNNHQTQIQEQRVIQSTRSHQNLHQNPQLQQKLYIGNSYRQQAPTSPTSNVYSSVVDLSQVVQRKKKNVSSVQPTQAPIQSNSSYIQLKQQQQQQQNQQQQQQSFIQQQYQKQTPIYTHYQKQQQVKMVRSNKSALGFYSVRQDPSTSDKNSPSPLQQCQVLVTLELRDQGILEKTALAMMRQGLTKQLQVYMGGQNVSLHEINASEINNVITNKIATEKNKRHDIQSQLEESKKSVIESQIEIVKLKHNNQEAQKQLERQTSKVQELEDHLNLLKQYIEQMEGNGNTGGNQGNESQLQLELQTNSDIQRMFGLSNNGNENYQIVETTTTQQDQDNSMIDESYRSRNLTIENGGGGSYDNENRSQIQYGQNKSIHQEKVRQDFDGIQCETELQQQQQNLFHYKEQVVKNSGRGNNRSNNKDAVTARSNLNVEMLSERTKHLELQLKQELKKLRLDNQNILINSGDGKANGSMESESTLPPTYRPPVGITAAKAGLPKSLSRCPASHRDMLLCSPIDQSQQNQANHPIIKEGQYLNKNNKRLSRGGHQQHLYSEQSKSMYTLQQHEQLTEEDNEVSQNDIIVISASNYENDKTLVVEEGLNAAAAGDTDEGNVDSLECEEVTDKQKRVSKLKKQTFLYGNSHHKKQNQQSIQQHQFLQPSAFNDGAQDFDNDGGLNFDESGLLEAQIAQETEDVEPLMSSRRLSKNVIQSLALSMKKDRKMNYYFNKNNAGSSNTNSNNNTNGNY